MSSGGQFHTLAFWQTTTPAKPTQRCSFQTCKSDSPLAVSKTESGIRSFGGEVVSPEMMEDPEKSKAFDLMDFLARNGKERRQPEIFECARALKEELDFKKVGALGFCYGGWAVFRLG